MPTVADPYMDTARAEWDLWQKLLTRLVLANAVTARDLKARVGDDATPGQRLLNLIREWGDARATLAIANAARQKEPS